jgi:hypothetical protein
VTRIAEPAIARRRIDIHNPDREPPADDTDNGTDIIKRFIKFPASNDRQFPA